MCVITESRNFIHEVGQEHFCTDPKTVLGNNNNKNNNNDDDDNNNNNNNNKNVLKPRVFLASHVRYIKTRGQLIGDGR